MIGIVVLLITIIVQICVLSWQFGCIERELKKIRKGKGET